MAVAKLGEKPTDGITDKNPEGLTSVTGKWAEQVCVLACLFARLLECVLVFPPVCVRAWVRACLRACVREVVCACFICVNVSMRARGHVYACVRACFRAYVLLTCLCVVGT